MQSSSPYGPDRPAPPVTPPGSPFPILVSTMNDVPGFRVEYVFGEAFGLTSRVIRALGVGFRSATGGEVHEFTRSFFESRHLAVMRMCEMAQGWGANAVLAMRFDCRDQAQFIGEVTAYGTAVVVLPAEP